MRYRFIMMMLAPTIGVSVLLLVVAAAAAWYAHRMNRDVSASVTQKVAGVIVAEQLLEEVRELRWELDGFAITGESARYAAAAAFARRIPKLLDAADRTVTTDESAGLCAQTRASYQQFSAQFEQLGQPPDPERASELVRLLESDILVLAAAVTEERESDVTTSAKRNQAMTSRIGIGIALLGICGAASGLLAGYGFARAVSRSVVQLSLPVRDMVGELDQVVGPISVVADGDLTGLEEAMRMLAVKTANVVRSLQESQRHALRAEQLMAVGQLASGLAHELRNPLMSLKLLVQTARERADQGGLAARDLEVMEEEIARQEKMLQTFLDFARPPRPQMGPLDVPTLIDQTVQFIQPRAAQQDVRIIPDYADLPALEGDESQLRQVLLNLLLNALDVLPRGGTVWIRAERVDTLPAASAEGELTNAMLVIRVSDDGPGLPPDDQSNIFEPFVSTKTTGVGLGLSISQRIMQSHGGEILAANREQGGAEFTMCLPLRGGTPHADRPADHHATIVPSPCART